MDCQDWADILQKAAKADKRSQAEIARAAGLTTAQLSRFLAGKRGLLLAPAARLAAVLGIRLSRSL